MFFYGLDRNYIDNYSDHIHSVAKEDVLYVAQNYFDCDNYAITALSNADQVKEKLSLLGKVTVKDYKEE